MKRTLHVILALLLAGSVFAFGGWGARVKKGVVIDGAASWSLGQWAVEAAPEGPLAAGQSGVLRLVGEVNGLRVVRELQGFGCRVLAYDPVEKDELSGLATYVDLPELLAASDVVTLHAPGLPENRHMIGADELARMREGAVLVNAARGSLVDTAALLDALESGHLGGAALDTIEDEAGLYYLDRSRDVLAGRDRAALMALPNVVVTPHMAFYTAEDVEGMVRSNVEALIAFAAGESTPYEV